MWPLVYADSVYVTRMIIGRSSRPWISPNVLPNVALWGHITYDMVEPRPKLGMEIQKDR